MGNKAECWLLALWCAFSCGFVGALIGEGIVALVRSTTGWGKGSWRAPLVLGFGILGALAGLVIASSILSLPDWH